MGAYGIVTDLTVAWYVVKQKDGRCSRNRIQAHLPLPEPASHEPAIGDVLALQEQPVGAKCRVIRWVSGLASHLRTSACLCVGAHSMTSQMEESQPAEPLWSAPCSCCQGLFR